MLCSGILNGIIILVFVKTKELHTPSNLLQVHLSAIGLLIPLFYSPFTLTAFLCAMIACDCTALYYHWLIGNVLHFGVYPFSILLLSISYFLILKFNSTVLSLPRAIVGLSLVWICSIILSFPTFLLATPEDYIGCCETVCQNGSALCNTSLSESFTPRFFTQEALTFYNFRDLVGVVVPSAIVFVTSAGSYIIYKRLSSKLTSISSVRNTNAIVANHTDYCSRWVHIWT